MFYSLFISRFIAVIYPLHYSNIMTVRKSVILLSILWVYACLTGAGPFYAGNWIQGETKCTLNSIMSPTYVILAITVQYPVCSGTMITLYSRVFYAAHQQMRRTSVTIGSLDHCSSNIALVKDTKTAKTLAMVLGAFIFFWTPFYFLATIQAMGYASDHLYTVLVATLSIGVCNSCLNPAIYCWKSSEFRKAYKTLLQKVCTANGGN